MDALLVWCSCRCVYRPQECPIYFYSKQVESSTKKVVGIVERLQHECSLSPRQGQYGCGCSKSYDHGSVSHIEEAKKDLVRDVHRLDRFGVRLEDSTNGNFMVYHNSDSYLVVEVKSKQQLDQLFF